MKKKHIYQYFSPDSSTRTEKRYMRGIFVSYKMMMILSRKSIMRRKTNIQILKNVWWYGGKIEHDFTQNVMVLITRRAGIGNSLVLKSSETSTKILNYFLNNTMQKYKPKISILKSLWLKKIKAYKHERYAIAIPGNPERMFYYFPLYNSFRYAGTHYYPESDSDLEVIIRCLSFKK